MHTYHADFLWRALDYVVKKLQGDSYLQSQQGKRVHNRHLSTFFQSGPTDRGRTENPEFPLTTVIQEGMGGDASIDNLHDVYLLIDVWGRNGPLELEKIYSTKDPSTSNPAGIRSLLHNGPRPGDSFVFDEVTIQLSVEMWKSSIMYDQETRLFRLSARYLLKLAAQTLVT